MNREEYKKQRYEDFKQIDILIDQHNQGRIFFEKSEEWYENQTAQICKGCEICLKIQEIGKKYYGKTVEVSTDKDVKSLAEEGKSKAEIKELLDLSDRELAVEVLKLPLDLKMNLK